MLAPLRIQRMKLLLAALPTLLVYFFGGQYFLRGLTVLAKQEILLVLVGGLFVLEAMSVIIQVASFKLRKKRVFRMSPLHHHFELSGWAEPKVIVRFWILSILFSLLSLSTLKLR